MQNHNVYDAKNEDLVIFWQISVNQLTVSYLVPVNQL